MTHVARLQGCPYTATSYRRRRIQVRRWHAVAWERAMPEQTVTARVEKLGKKNGIARRPGRQGPASRQEFKGELQAAKKRIARSDSGGRRGNAPVMRVLHEEVLSRMATISESLPQRCKQ
jgi:hypothetical protein